MQNSYRAFKAYIIFIILFSSTGLSQIYAQGAAEHATLVGWEERTLNFMLDRSHNFGGTNYNRGLFRDNINLMSPEHEIDLLTYRFTFVEDFNWQMADEAYRLSFGSLNATDFAVENKIKSTYDIDKNNSLLINGTHEENFRASRFFFQLGYEHHFKGNHHVGGSHTFLNDKSDLDLTAYYRYGTLEEGMVYAGITLLDWTGNVVQGLADDSDNRYNDTYDLTFKYEKSPKLLNLKLISPQVGNFRAEILAGLQTFSQKLVNPSGDTLDFRDQEWAHYAGALIEYAYSKGIVGFTYQRRFSKLRRRPAQGSQFEEDFNNWQFSDRGGFFATGRFGHFQLEQWLWLERNVDRLQGERVPDDLAPDYLPNERRPFNFIERRLKIKSRVLYGSLEKGIQTGIEFHADYRYPQGEKAPGSGVRNFDFRNVYPIVRNRNERMTLTIGYRVNENFYLLGGISYDLDKDKQSGIGLPRITGTPTWFDGGFGRISLNW